jgi:CheY-like chemotaxis protein
MSAEAPLSGLQVLVVEDEAVVSMLLEDMLEELGARVVGPAARLDRAFGLLDDGSTRIDAAVLDVNLGDGADTFALADAMRARGIPFIFTTGYNASVLPERLRGCGLLRKPYRIEALRDTLRRAVAP